MNQPTPPQPGPHGAYPPPPAPYGLPPQPGAHPAHPPQPGPYGVHPPQYPPHPAHRAAGPWGAPPPVAPPPGRKRTLPVVGVVLGSVSVLAGLAYLGGRVVGAGGTARPLPAAEYRLTVPGTLLDGDYRLAEDRSEEMDARARKETDSDGPGWRITSTVVGTYDGTAADVQRRLTLVGMSGRFEKPERQRDKFLKGMREADGVREARPSRTVRPPGSDVELRCTVLLLDEAAGTSTVPVCAWGDANTIAYVAFPAPPGTAPDPDSVDLTATARRVLGVRAEARRPTG